VYDFDISTVSTFASHIAGFPRQVNGERESVSLPDGTYYWRVRPVSISPLTGTWEPAGPYSATISFTVDTIPPAAPAFTAPASNATVSSARPTLTWTSVPEAARYMLSIASTYVIYEPNLTTTSYTPTEDLAPGQYWAWIQAIDAAGNVSATSGEVQFIVTGTQISGFTWVRAASQPRNNGQAQGIVLNGRLYSFGGYAPCCTPSALSYSYDPNEDVWVPIADMPAPVVKAGIATDGQFIYIAGGYLKRPTGGQYYGTTNVWRYDPVANTYTAITPLPVANSTGQLVYVNNELHYIGGTTANTRAQDLDTHWVLDLSAPNAGWVNEAPLPVPRHHAAAVVIGTTIYYIGGQKGHDANLIPQNAVHAYDTITNTWTTLAPMPGLGRNHMSHSVVVINGKIYVFGGQTYEKQVVDNITEYDPATNTWREAGTLFAARGSAIVGLIDGVVYFATGDSAATYKGYYAPQPLKIENFTLIDTAKDYPIAVIREGSTINLTDQPTALSIGIVFSGSPIGSVVMGWNANPRYRVENGAPFAFYDNSATNYSSGPIPVGANTITATPYSGPNGSGTAGTPLTIHFTVLANANKVPKITNPGTQYSWIEKPITPLQIVVTDPNGDAVTYSATGLPPGLSLNTTTGVISGTPKSSSVVGPHTYTVEIRVKEIRTYPFTTQMSFQWIVYPED
jgi:N-acetylneuraminic acid mutarotase